MRTYFEDARARGLLVQLNDANQQVHEWRGFDVPQDALDHGRLGLDECEHLGRQSALTDTYDSGYHVTSAGFLLKNVALIFAK